MLSESLRHITISFPVASTFIKISPFNLLSSTDDNRMTSCIISSISTLKSPRSQSQLNLTTRTWNMRSPAKTRVPDEWTSYVHMHASALLTNNNNAAQKLPLPLLPEPESPHSRQQTNEPTQFGVRRTRSRFVGALVRWKSTRVARNFRFVVCMCAWRAISRFWGCSGAGKKMCEGICEMVAILVFGEIG